MLEQIRALQAACLAADGGRLKLELPVLAKRSGERDDDFFWTLGSDLVGFAGIYQFGAAQAELIGMVHPAWRRRGIFTRLLGAATSELRRRGEASVLLIVHRGFEAGAGLVAKLGATLEHSEHRMRQTAAPPALRPGEPLVVRAAGPGDGPFVHDCLAAAFGMPGDRQRGVEAGMKVIEDVVDGARRAVGVMRVDRDGPVEASVYGFAVSPELQGRGIGRRALCQETARLRADGVETVRLEVSVENDHALRLYERCGFEPLGTEDYFELLLGQP